MSILFILERVDYAQLSIINYGKCLMISDPPSLDTRTFEDIVREIEVLARSYLDNQWINATGINAIRNYKPNNNSLARINITQNLSGRNSDNLRGDVGIALSKIFASFYMNILSRLNKLPKRNFIEFLNIMGFSLTPPIASRVPVTFKLSEGAKEDVFVPSGTTVASDANDKHEELIFETEQNMQVTRANILQLYAVNTKKDSIYSHTENLKIKKEFKLFPDHNQNIQQHILYLGHQDLFNLKNTPARIFLTIESDEKQNLLLLGDKKTVVWEYVWKYDDKSKEITVGEFDFDVMNTASNLNESSRVEEEKEITIVLRNKNRPEKKIEKAKINGIENHWIRCRFHPPPGKWNFADIESDKIPAITKITAKVMLDTDGPFDGNGFSSLSEETQPSSSTTTPPPTEVTNNGNKMKATNGGFIKPDLLFYKDTPIQVPLEDNNEPHNDESGSESEDEDENEDVREDESDISRSRNTHGPDNSDKSDSDGFVYPFGKQPFTFDIFFIASNDCFSKKNTIITLKFFEANPDFKGTKIGESEEDEKIILPIISWEYWNGKGWNGLPVLSHVLENNHEELKFLCPNDIDVFSVNGNDNYWIRARLVSGDYGKGNLVQKTSSTLTTRETRTVNTAEDESGTVDTTEKTTEWNAGTFEWDYRDIKAPRFKQVKVKFDDPQSFSRENEDQVERLNQVIDSQTLEMASRLVCMSYNNLEYKEIPNSNDQGSRAINPTRVFERFIDHDNNRIQNSESHLPQSSTSYRYIYIGFDKKIESGPIQIYVSILEARNYHDVGQQLNFYYYSPSGWKKLYVEDGTNYFTRRGYIKLFFPSDFQPNFLFGNSLYWIRIEDSANFYENEPSRVPKVHDFILNTVSCINAYAVEDELLTKEEKTLNENKFLFSKKPLTLIENKTEQIWVKEKVLPSDIEWKTLSEDDRTRTIKDDLGNILESWVLWKEFGYQNFITGGPSHLSSSSSPYNTRIYSIDRIGGKLNLGSVYEDSLQGTEASLNGDGILLPSMMQIGVDTLVKASYIVGGGNQGNVNAEDVKTLKSLVPFIDSVTNFDKGRGGSDIQDIQEAIEIMPSLIKNRGQAVTIEDFESLIISNFATLSRVRCFPTTDNRGIFHPGHVLVVVIPKIDIAVNKNNKGSPLPDKTGPSLIEEMPYPSVPLLRNIKQFLNRTASDTVVSPENLHVTGPSYFRINISADLFVNTIDDLPIAGRKALDLIKKFLDPLRGGKGGKGWEFQKILSIYDVYALFSSIPEVKYIDNVFVKIELDEENIVNLENSNSDKPRNEYVLSEANNNINAITSMLLPYSLLCDGNAHNITMRISNHK